MTQRSRRERQGGVEPMAQRGVACASDEMASGSFGFDARNCALSHAYVYETQLQRPVDMRTGAEGTRRGNQAPRGCSPGGAKDSVGTDRVSST